VVGGDREVGRIYFEQELPEPIWFCAVSSSPHSIEPPTHFLGGFENRHRLFSDRNIRAGSRIASGMGGAMLYRKNPKAAQLDPLAALQGIDNPAENDVDDILHVTMQEVPVLLSDALHKFGLKHCIHLIFFPRRASNDTPRRNALLRVAPSVRFSFRAITVVFTLPRASVFSMRTSSFVQSRRFIVFFAISVLRALLLLTNQRRSYNKNVHLAWAPEVISIF
jgi:hypothetical protein